MKNKILSLMLVSLSIFVIGCGGGSSSINENSQFDADDAYSGIRSKTVLDNSNFESYVNLLLGDTSKFSGELALKESKVKREIKDLNVLKINAILKKTLNNLLTKKSQKPYYQSRSISEVENCSQGGRIELNGNVNDSEETALINVQYINCMIEESTINGFAKLNIVQLGDFVDKTILSYSNLEFFVDNESYFLTGEIQTDELIEVGELIKEVLLVNMHISTNEKEIWYKDLITITDLDTSINIGSKVNGRIYDGDQGFVDVITNTPYEYLTVLSKFPSNGGSITVRGASLTKFQLRPYEEDTIKVFLDFDGVGGYERNVDYGSASF